MSENLPAPTQQNALATLLADTDRLRDVTVEIIERLYALDKDRRAEMAKQDYAVAFVALQAAIIPVEKRGKGDHGTMFAKAEDVFEMVRPLLAKHGFSYSTSTSDSTISDHVRYVLRLRHVGGHTEEHYMDAPADTTGPKGGATKTRLHGLTSSYTLCERTLVIKVLGIPVFKDDDGRAAVDHGPRITPAQVTELNRVADEVGADKAAFCRLLKVDALPELPASQFAVARLALKAKRKEPEE